MMKPKHTNGTKLNWTMEGQTSFETLRELVSNCPLLHFPDDSSPIILRTDASDFGIWGVLFQTIQGVENPMYPILTIGTTLHIRSSIADSKSVLCSLSVDVVSKLHPSSYLT